MRIEALTIENFRGYLQPTSITAGDFTAIIGRNDVGKSTLLEALEVFFNGGKLDADDAHVRGRGQVTRVACRFGGLPSEVILDASAPTTLADEHLINADGLLEIVKEYDLSASKIASKIFARALHPTADGAGDLLQLSNAKLKVRARELGVDLTGVDQRVNTRIRRAIWDHVGALGSQERLVPLNDEEAKKVWNLLQKDIPTFALFRSDRPSRDDDNEVTDPFDAAIRDAVKALEPQLDAIKEEVKQRVKEVSDRTLAKLREMDPSLADELKADFRRAEMDGIQALAYRPP